MPGEKQWMEDILEYKEKRIRIFSNAINDAYKDICYLKSRPKGEKRYWNYLCSKWITLKIAVKRRRFCMRELKKGLGPIGPDWIRRVLGKKMN
jgi:hypothetical protein